MTPSRLLFLKKLCGDNFNREIGTPYREPCYHFNAMVRKFKHHERLGDPFYCSVYDFNHSNQIPYKKPSRSYVYPYSENVILDKIFFDFDKDYTLAAKEEIEKNRPTVNSKRNFILSLLKAGRVKEPIKQAKDTALYIKEHYGGDPFLVFSGSKGCHLYIFFEPVQLEHPKEVLSRITHDLRDQGLFNFSTDNETPGLLDTAPIGDVARISRAPGSIHPQTGLYCHPFKLDYSYGEIIENSQKDEPPYTDFNPENMKSGLDTVLKEYDQVINEELEVLKYQRAFRELEPRQPLRNRGERLQIQKPEDILKLNSFPCFQGAPYDHNLRVILSCLCLWMGLSPEETATAIKIFSEDKGVYEENKHLHDHKNINKLKRGEFPQYVFTCNSFKRLHICRECKKWFYLKVKLPDKYYERIKNHDKF